MSDDANRCCCHAGSAGAREAGAVTAAAAGGGVTPKREHASRLATQSRATSANEESGAAGAPG